MIVQGLPHACGGVFAFPGQGRGERQSSPRMWGCFDADLPAQDFPESSPRMWGCFLYRAQAVPCSSVFPTHVGVFPGQNGD